MSKKKNAKSNKTKEVPNSKRKVNKFSSIIIYKNLLGKKAVNGMIVNMLNGKNMQERILYPARL